MVTLTHTTHSLRWHIIRFLCDVLLVAAALVGLFWPTVIGALLILFLFRAYEVIIIALLLDSVVAPLYGLPIGDFPSTVILLLATTIALYLFRVTRYLPII